MQFCRECNNLLYPREDKVAKKLVYACAQCRYEQEADSPVVFKHEVVKSVRNQLEKIPDGIIADPTLGREPNEVCPKCAQAGAVFIMPKITPADNRIKLIFVCTNSACCHKWQG